MATAYVSALNDENENCVEPKNKATKKRSLDDIRRKVIKIKMNLSLILHLDKFYY